MLDARQQKLNNHGRGHWGADGSSSMWESTNQLFIEQSVAVDAV